MRTKKKEIKEIQFIAVDTYRDEFIFIGNRSDVQDQVQSHCDLEGYDDEEVRDNILVYELGEMYPVGVHTVMEISF